MAQSVRTDESVNQAVIPKGLGPWTNEEAPDSCVTYPTSGTKGSKSEGHFQFKENEGKPKNVCSICSAMGIPHNHSTQACWANPENPNHKPFVVSSKMKYCKDKGIAIPEFE